MATPQKTTKTKTEASTEAKPGAEIVKATPTSVIAWNEADVTGFENVGAEDLGIPFLTIIQKGSAEFDTTHQKYREKKIDGCAVGDVIDIIARQVVYKAGGEPIVVVPVHWDKLYMEWKPRTATGGGIVQAHKDPAILNNCRRNSKNLDELPNGNIIVTTAYFHVVEIKDGALGKRYMIGMSSTQLTKSRRWLNMAQSIKIRVPNGSLITPPIFSHAYALSTQPESNDKGSWMGWSIAVHDMVTDGSMAEELLEIAKGCKITGTDDAVKSSAAASDDVI